ncbi:MAG: SLATT domain-containing protein [Amphritea sp.]|nr:SLATT domain-containing protein [Amphritea sp.]
MNVDALITRMKEDCKIRGNAHRNRFSFYRQIHISIGLPSALLATVAGSVATINANNAGDDVFSALDIISLLVAWVVALLTAANSFLNPHQTSQSHRDKATGYDVQFGKIGRAQAFLQNDDLKNQLEEIDARIEELKLSEPILSDRQIAKTKQALMQSGELNQVCGM